MDFWGTYMGDRSCKVNHPIRVVLSNPRLPVLSGVYPCPSAHAQRPPTSATGPHSALYNTVSSQDASCKESPQTRKWDSQQESVTLAK